MLLFLLKMNKAIADVGIINFGDDGDRRLMMNRCAAGAGMNGRRRRWCL